MLSLVKAWKKQSDRIRFVYSSDRTLTRLAPFDVVFCMAVLRAPKKQQRLGVHRGSYDRIPVAAQHDKGVFLPDGVTEVEPDGCLWRKREP